MNRRTGIAIVFACIVLCGILFWIGTSQTTPQSTIQEAEAHWSDRIHAIGARAAFAEMVQSVASDDAVTQHLAAHAFGGALFQSGGTAAYSVCTDVYASGCYHQFMAEAVTAGGLASVSALRISCDQLGENRWPCIHGIGHGLVGYLGYGIDDLREALQMCASSVGEGETAQCQKGAFMEYDLRRILNATDGTAIRPYTYADRFTPCTQLDGAAQSSCYWGRAWWWYLSAPSPTAHSDAFFKTIGSYCTEVADEKPQIECFKGIGFAVSFASTLDTAAMAHLCDASTESAARRVSCRIGAAVNTFHETNRPLSEICPALGLSGAWLRKCIDAEKNGDVWVGDSAL